MLKISIITVSYNSAKTIEQTIQSVLSQRYSNVEYIIIDGASQDETLSIIEKYRNKISVVISEKDNGIYNAMNKGIKLATGDIIGILNSDDFYVDENVLNDVATLFEHNKADAVYADLQYVDAIDTRKIKRNWKSGKYKPGDFLFGWMPPHPTFFVKKELYQKYGLFNEELKSAADYELMLRFIHKHQISIDYLPRVIVKMRSGGHSNITTKNRIKANLEDRKAWELNGLKPFFFTLFLKPLRKLNQFRVK
ncbi:MAG: glycosyl transferase [Candidatus Woesearchaeota archaeon]|nr:MAG: glycosyl transferase [Candidatus Woesearchaeota archaeon]